MLSIKTLDDSGRSLYNRSMILWLQNIDIKMYSRFNEEKCSYLKNKIYKYMTSISRTVCIDKLDDIVNEYNNTHHSTNKMKLSDVKLSTCIDFKVEKIGKDPKLKAGDDVRIPKFKKIGLKKFL